MHEKIALPVEVYSAFKMLRLRIVASQSNAWIKSTLRNLSTLPTNENVTSLDRLLRFKPALQKTEHKSWYRDTHNPLDYDNEDDDSENWEVEDGSGIQMDEKDPLFQVGKQLMKLGRVPYRHMEDMPQWLSDRLGMVTSHRTSPQIRRCLKDWMIKSDREEYTMYRSKRLFWRKQDKDETHKPMLHAYGPDETIAYAHYYVPARFGITRRVYV